MAKTEFGSHSDYLPSSTHTQPIQPVRVIEASLWAGIQAIQEFCCLTGALGSRERKHETKNPSRCLPLSRITDERTITRRYFKHIHFIPIVGIGERRIFIDPR